MRLSIRVDVAESVRRGVAAPVEQPAVIEVDPKQLSPEDRAVLASRLTDDGQVASRNEEGYLLSDRCQMPGPVKPSGEKYRVVRAPAPTIEALIEAIRAEDEAIRTFAARKEAAAAAKAEAERAESLRRMDDPHTGGRVAYLYLTDVGGLVDKDYEYSRNYWADDGIIAGRKYEWTARWMPHLPSAEVRDSAEAKQRMAAWESETAAARAAAHAEAEESLHQEDMPRVAWIDDHGSPRLQRLYAEGIGHRRVYLAEREAWEEDRLEADLAVHRPGWIPAEADELNHAVRDLTDRDLAILDIARRAAPGAKLADLGGRIVAWERYTTSYGVAVTIVWPQG